MRARLAAYAAMLAASAFALEWLDYRRAVRAFSTEAYVLVIAFGFLGVWAGRQLTPRPSDSDFSRNDAALKSLGVSNREFEILELLAAGHTNKEIARALDVSPNTIKTHLSNLYAKLDVSRRTQAIDKARSLSLIP